MRNLAITPRALFASWKTRISIQGLCFFIATSGVTVIAFLLLAVPALTQTTYRDPGGAFAVGVPVGWKAEKDPNTNQVTVSKGDVAVAMQVNTMQDGSAPTPKEVLDQIEQELKQDPCSDMSERRDGAVAGYTGQYFMIVCDVPGHGRMADTVSVAITNGKILIEMTSLNPAQFSGAANDLQSIYGNFRLIGNGGVQQGGGEPNQLAHRESTPAQVSHPRFIRQLDENLWIAGLPSTNVEQSAASSTWGRQRMENWCWAASVQMTLNMAGIRVTQEQVVERIYGDDIDKPANPQQIIEALTGWAPMIDGTMVLLNPRPLTNDKDMVKDLSLGWPLIVGLKNSDGSGHAEVITAITYGLQPNGDPDFRSVILRNPWPDSPSREEMTWSEFVNRRAFVIRNQISHPHGN